MPAEIAALRNKAMAAPEDTVIFYYSPNYFVAKHGWIVSIENNKPACTIYYMQGADSEDYQTGDESKNEGPLKNDQQKRLIVKAIEDSHVSTSEVCLAIDSLPYVHWNSHLYFTHASPVYVIARKGGKPPVVSIGYNVDYRFRSTWKEGGDPRGRFDFYHRLSRNVFSEQDSNK